VPGECVVGMALPRFSATVDGARTRAFIDAIGEDRSEYRDRNAALAAGYRELPVPPTYLFVLEYERPQPYLALDVLGVPLSAVLHAKQAFDYRAQCYVGDDLDFTPVITSYTEKKDGRLGFLERRTTVRRDGAVVAYLVNVLAIRWEAVPA
jgi:hypothetical protein